MGKMLGDLLTAWLAPPPVIGAGVDLSGWQKMLAGLLAGAAACTFTYPLEALR